MKALALAAAVCALGAIALPGPTPAQVAAPTFERVVLSSVTRNPAATQWVGTSSVDWLGGEAENADGAAGVPANPQELGPVDRRAAQVLLNAMTFTIGWHGRRSEAHLGDPLVGTIDRERELRTASFAVALADWISFGFGASDGTIEERTSSPFTVTGQDVRLRQWGTSLRLGGVHLGYALAEEKADPLGPATNPASRNITRMGLGWFDTMGTVRLHVELAQEERDPLPAPVLPGVPGDRDEATADSAVFEIELYDILVGAYGEGENRTSRTALGVVVQDDEIDRERFALGYSPREGFALIWSAERETVLDLLTSSSIERSGQSVTVSYRF